MPFYDLGAGPMPGIDPAPCKTRGELGETSLGILQSPQLHTSAKEGVQRAKVRANGPGLGMELLVVAGGGGWWLNDG